MEVETLYLGLDRQTSPEVPKRARIPSPEGFPHGRSRSVGLLGIIMRARARMCQRVDRACSAGHTVAP